MTITPEPSVPGEAPVPVEPAPVPVTPLPVVMTADQFAALLATVTPAPGLVATVETKVSTAASDLVTELETLVASAKAKIEADAATVSTGATSTVTAAETYLQSNFLAMIALAAAVTALVVEFLPAFVK